MITDRSCHYLSCFLRILAFSALLAATARSAPEEKHSYNLPSGDAAVLLQEFSQISGKEVLYAAEVVRGVKTSPVQGDYTATEALDRMLLGTNLYELLDEKTGAISILRKAPVENATKAKETTSQSDLNREPVREIVKLSVYEVSATAYNGYVAAKTLSGSKVAMDILEMPQTINVVTRDMLDDIGEHDPGMAMSKMAPGVTEYFNPAPGVGMLIRGFNAQNWAVDGATTRLLGMVTNFNYDALEVIKGPSALLFGPFGSFGGYVNMVPKYAEHDVKKKIEATVGTGNYYSGMLDFGATLGKNDYIQYRLVLGILDNERPGYDEDYAKGYTIAPSVSFDLNERMRLKLRLETNHMDQRWSRGTVNENNEYVRGFSANGPIPGRRTLSDNWTLQTVLTGQVSENFAYKFNFLYQSEDQNYLLGYLNGLQPAQDYPYLLDKRTLGTRTFYADFSTVWTIPDRGNGISNQFITGANYNYYNAPWAFSAFSNQYPEYAGIRIDPENPDWGPVSRINLDYPTLIYDYNRSYIGGIIALNTLSLLDGKIKILAGARYNHDQRTDQKQTRKARNDPLVTTTAPILTSKKITLKYGVVYKVTDNLAAYYGHDEAYLPVGAVHRADGVPIKPQSGENDEVGIKLDLFEALGGNFSGSIAYFDLTVTNKWLSDVLNPGFVVQNGVANNKGFDAQVNYSNEKLSLTFGMYQADGPTEVSPPTGLRSIRVPETTYNIWGKYNLTPKLALGGGYHYIGNSLSATRAYKAPGFGASDLFVRYTTKFHRGMLSYRLVVSNLTDEDAITMYHIPSMVITENARAVKLTTSYSW